MYKARAGLVDALEEAPMYEGELKLLGVSVAFPAYAGKRLRTYRVEDRLFQVTLRHNGAITIWNMQGDATDCEGGWSEAYPILRGLLLDESS